MMLSMANLRKAKNYLKKNGYKNTYYAVAERFAQRKEKKYTYEAPSEEELAQQREEKWDRAPLLSVIVPAYETKKVFLEDLILSMMDQTYPHFELIIADASKSDAVKRVVLDFQEQYGKIEYVKLEENKGISENSNAALQLAKGEYIGLLDHDDLVTPDALYHVAKEILRARKQSGSPVLIYTDEDKTNTYLEHFYEPNIKLKLNQDLIMSNNYICHLSFFRRDVIQELGFRKEYDGAQDYDLILRTLFWAETKYGKEEWEKRICHIPKVLYHWRCHEESTAQNPESKRYAYEAGKRAVAYYLSQKGWDAKVEDLMHLGFYRVEYGEDIFRIRKDLGVVGGPIYEKDKITGGAMDGKGKILYEKLNRYFSGYLHRAVLQQQVAAVDARNMIVRDDLIPLFEKHFGISYEEREETWKTLTSEEKEKIRKKSLQFCNKMKSKNIGVLYDPMLRRP